MLNEGRTKPLDSEKAKDILHTKCSNALKAFSRNKRYIFRGIQDFDGDYGYINSSNFEDRTSANASNEYTILINDILPSWKKYPKRNIICTISGAYASDYGVTYNVFPFNGTKIGVCPSMDIWSSFAYSLGGHTLPYINNFIIRLLYYITTAVDDINKIIY